MATKTAGSKLSPRTAKGPRPAKLETAPPAPSVAPATVFGATASAKLLGEVVTWNVSGAVKYADLTAALRAAGLDEKVARELAPRHAFTRACKKLSDDRIIRQVDDDGDTITFQFTKESKVGDQYEYALETRLVLDKKSGAVTCEKEDLRAAAQAALDECIAVRTSGDVTTCIQKLFEKHADLFRIREQGGCYFVPERFADFLTKIDGFVRGVNGVLRRFPVPAGTAHGDRSVRDAVADGLKDVIEEHKKAVAEFDIDTRGASFERAAEKIKETRFKVEMYADYLGELKEQLTGALTEASAALKTRITDIVTAEPVYLAESDDAWGKGPTVEAATRELWRVAEYPEGADPIYRVWKVHPATTMNPSGAFVCHVSGAAAPELVRTHTEEPAPEPAPMPPEPAHPAPEPAPARTKRAPAARTAPETPAAAPGSDSESLWD
ncbi:MAG TPA: DUF6744 family protein [Gemmata sp.]